MAVPRGLLHPCVCGFVAETPYRMPTHRRRCAAWQSRDVRLVRLERQRDARTQRGLFNPEHVCLECGYVEHREGCSHQRRGRHARMMGGKAVLQAVLVGVAHRGLPKKDPDDLSPKPKRAILWQRRDPMAGYSVTLECGHVVTRTVVPALVFCNQCRKA